MPTYSCMCEKCEHTIEVFHSMSANPRVKCEECSAKCIRLIGTGAGIIFKGSGFYETDYKDKKGKPPEKEKKKSDSKATTAATESTSDSGSASKKKSSDAK
jgi:putative FmdB family regulatory protein